MNIKSLFFILGILSILTSCQEENNEVVIAKVQDYKLLKSELNTETPINLNTDDSLIFVQNFIYNWVVDHLISNKAAELIPSEVQKVEKKIEKYKLSHSDNVPENFLLPCINSLVLNSNSIPM